MNRIIRFVAAACSVAPAWAFATTLTAQKVWETEAQFRNPESVVYDEVRNILYVSNVDGDGLNKDGQGFISQLTPEGQIVNLEWVRGLNAPKGMALVNDRLYVADIDELVEIDVNTGTVSHYYPVSGAQFLNDVTADSVGTVYVSDMFTNRIHRLYHGVLETWMTGSNLQSPNGLLANDGKIYVGTWGARRTGFDTDLLGHIKVISAADR